MGLLGRCTHVGDDESYTAVGESSKYDLEAQCEWGQQRPRHMENLHRQNVKPYINPEEGFF